METELIKTFLEVKDCRHFGKAAENLYLTQAAVSTRIRQLEQYFGVTLFVRNRNNIQLTQAGERLVSHAEAMLNILQLAKQDVAVAAEQSLQISIAGTPNTWDIYINYVIAKIYTENPQINLVAEILSREQLTRQLLERSLDLAILFDPPKAEELTIERIASVELLPVTSSRHIDSDKPLGNQYIFIDWGTNFKIWHARQYRDINPPAVRTSTGRIALDLLLQCGGTAYLPDILVKPYLDSGELHLMDHLPGFERDIYFAFHRDNGHENKIMAIKQQLQALSA